MFSILSHAIDYVLGKVLSDYNEHIEKEQQHDDFGSPIDVTEIISPKLAEEDEEQDVLLSALVDDEEKLVNSKMASFMGKITQVHFILPII